MPQVTVENGVPSVAVDEAILFPFDKFTVPLQDGLQLNLVSARKQPPVVRRGDPGEPDSRHVRFFGSVIRVDGQLRMYYVGVGPDASISPTRPATPGRRNGLLCYATSQDGFHWEKPALGLVEYDGSKQNNVLSLGPSPRTDHESLAVLHDPEDSGRPFKMIFCPSGYPGTGVAYSQDGLRWKESPDNPVIGAIHGGLTKFNGCYYVNAQRTLTLGSVARKMHTHVSHDFENWTAASAGSFQRDVPRVWRVAPGAHRGEQVHTGAALWNRGNVILGFYGQWHGAKNNDRRHNSVDIGLIVSNDALHFYEPIADFPIIPCGEEPDDARPALLQGQGVHNIGEQTLSWYTALYEGDVRVATWPRDRLGYYSVYQPFGGPVRAVPHFISCPVQLGSGGARVFVNADGFSEHNHITVEILDREFKGVKGYSGEDCTPIAEDGFRQQVVWRDRQTIDGPDHPVRIRVNYGGVRPEDIRVYAVYVSA